jgi:hypothetical protein
MMEISVQKKPAGWLISRPCESFGAPVGALPLQTNAGFFESDLCAEVSYIPERGMRAWCYRVDLELTEFCYLLEGQWEIYVLRERPCGVWPP